MHLQDGCPCWKDGCLQIWQIPQWYKQDGCSHGKKPCGMVASSPIAGTMLELHAALSRTDFPCYTECTDGHMPYMYLPDANAAVSNTLYTLLGTVESTKECTTSTYPVVLKYILCCAKQRY